MFINFIYSSMYLLILTSKCIPSPLSCNSGKLPAMQETLVRFLGWEDPLEEGTATDSSILAWRIPWTEEPGRLQSIGLRSVSHSVMSDSL